ncbi:MAG: serine hydrolase domain-containing protein [Planctomycetota bacterium]
MPAIQSPCRFLHLVPRRLALVALLALVAGSGRLALGEPEASPAGDAEIAALLRPLREKAGIPALGGAVVRLGQPTRAAAVGVRKAGDEAAATVGDRWHLGSCTKAMTATLAEIVAAETALDLDAPVRDAFADVDLDGGWEGVTLRRWLAHRGGLVTAYPRPLWSWLWKREVDPRQQRTRIAKEVLGAAPARALDAGFQYSNMGFDLVGAALERALDRDFETLATEHLFAPLGMTSAAFGSPGAPDVVDQPWGHRRVGEALVPVPPSLDGDNPPSLSPAGRAAMTLEDWGRFVALHLGHVVTVARPGREPGPLLAPEALARLHTPLEGEDYAGGWKVTKRGWSKGPVLTHAGSNTMWFCVCWLAPEEGFAALAVTNVGGAEAEKACDQVAGALIRLARAPEAARAK